MKLDRTIYLYEPGPRQEGTRLRGAPTVHRIYAGRQARQGSESIAQDTRFEEKRVTYMIRYNDLTSRIDTQWWLRDSGLDYRIESVYEPPIGRRQFLALVTVARR